jgi:hypothetical protein
MKKNDLADSDFSFAPCGTLFSAKSSATDPSEALIMEHVA